MRERLIGLIQSSVDGCARHWAEVIADHLLANGVIVPPCKVGDKVYWIGQFNQVVEGKATMIGTSFGAKVPYLDYEFGFTSDDIDKTVFLTREEAEQALKGGEG